MIEAGVLIDLCAGCLIYNESIDTVDLTFSGMREILKDHALLQNANTKIAQKCLVCLRPGFFTAKNGLEAYAMNHWGWHLQQSNDPHLRGLIPLLRDEQCVARMCGVMNAASVTLGDDVPYNVSGLSLAAYLDLLDAVSELAKEDSITSKDSLGMSALPWAAVRGATFPAVAKCLLDHGADIDPVDAKGRTTLHLAMSNENTALATLLIVHGADTDGRDMHGNTPLHRAAHFGVPDMVPTLLHYCDEGVEARNFHNQTPLHHAAREGRKENVRILLENGASISAEDRWGRTPRDLAAENKHVEVVEMLDGVPSLK